jgi:F420-non-reducing hydrogenase iron-sulfur subunit
MTASCENPRPGPAGAPAGAGRSPEGAAFEPKVVAFVCNWCTYTGADLAGTSRLKMAPNVRVLRVPCSSRVSPLFVIKAFERGADGVIVSGCHAGDCHFGTGNYHARRRFAVLRELLDLMGVEPGRVTFSWVSASEGPKWQQVVNDTAARVRALGPFREHPARVIPANGEAERP